MLVGVGYTAREICDGQTLASPGRWPIDQRRCPESPVSRSVTQLFLSCASLPGTAELLPMLALGQVDGCPLDGCPFSVAFCLSARGVRPTLCAHATPAPRSYPRRKRWRRLAQADPLHLADASSEHCVWRHNYASVGALERQGNRRTERTIYEKAGTGTWRRHCPQSVSKPCRRLPACATEGQTPRRCQSPCSLPRDSRLISQQPYTYQRPRAGADCSGHQTMLEQAKLGSRVVL